MGVLAVHHAVSHVSFPGIRQYTMSGSTGWWADPASRVVLLCWWACSSSSTATQQLPGEQHVCVDMGGDMQQLQDLLESRQCCLHDHKFNVA